ncbi:MAG TPA: CaiB/BaiF CoA-transferase family protein [Burkholderiales bacterium]|nr:CaiB/BaiF CoA-transferase family protein [Burkholderiales bacterium]
MQEWLPLAGVRVVDFAMFIPGPFCSAIFADLGAEVIKVEAPKGDPGRSYIPPQFRMENRNKRSIAIDLKNKDAAAVTGKLIQHADIVLEGFRPGVAKRLSIDYDTLKKSKPDLIYCSISGYGQTGPWRERPGHDVNYVAAAGGLAFPGQWLQPPTRSSLPIADMAGGSFAAIAVLSALVERQKTGKGAYLDLSLFEAGFFWAAMRHTLDAHADPKAHIFPVNDVFETKDGKRLTLGILEEHFWENFRAVVPGFGFDSEDFSSDSSRRKNGDALSRKLAEAMKTKTAAEWVKLCEEHDIPVDLCVTPAEAAVSNPQLRERGAAKEGQVTFPVFANGRRGGSLRAGVPKLGEHSREILVELGFDDADIAGFVQSGAVRAA